MRGDSSGNGWTVVTGASSGIGLAFARMLVRRGRRVLAVARRRDRLEALEREPAEQGGSIVPLVADLQTGEELGLVVERIVGLLVFLNRVLPRAVVSWMVGVSAKPPLQPSAQR